MKLPFYMRSTKTEIVDGQYVVTISMNKFQMFCLVVCYGSQIICRRIFHFFWYVSKTIWRRIFLK